MESIIIGDDVEICLLDIKGDKVRLGIRAPKTVSVHRKEVYEEIQSANVAASRPDLANLASLNKLIDKDYDSGRDPDSGA
jgi:carbon storage regulator